MLDVTFLQFVDPAFFDQELFVGFAHIREGQRLIFIKAFLFGMFIQPLVWFVVAGITMRTTDQNGSDFYVMRNEDPASVYTASHFFLITFSVSLFFGKLLA